MNGLESLGHEAKQKIQVAMSKKAVVSPLIIIDNIDMQERIHHTRLDQKTQMYHGSWGYIHQLNPKLLNNLEPDAFSKQKIHDILHTTAKSDIDLGYLIQTEEEQKSWILTLKNQIASVLNRYVKDTSKISKSTFLKVKSVDQIKFQVPDILMLKMMDSTNNGSDGVGQLWQEVINQTGLTKEEFSNQTQILEGDLGTCLNFDVLRNQREPVGVFNLNLKLEG